MGDNEARNLTKPGTPAPLYGGAYLWVQVDSGATQALVAAGLAAFAKFDSSATGPSTFRVTTEDQVVTNAKALKAGVFLNSVTPGNWGFIFAGAGRVTVQYKTGLTNGAAAIGDNIVVGGLLGTFDDASAATVAPTGLAIGTAVSLPVSAGTGVVYIPNILYRVPD